MAGFDKWANAEKLRRAGWTVVHTEAGYACTPPERVISALQSKPLDDTYQAIYIHWIVTGEDLDEDPDGA